MNTDPLLVFYAVRNRDGKYFRAKGYGGYGNTWVDELAKARIYSKISPARAQVTFFANNYPNYGIPKLVELHVTKLVSLEETERVKQLQERKKMETAKREERCAKDKMEYAERQLKAAQDIITKLRIKIK